MDLYLSQINFLEIIPDWIETLALIFSGFGGGLAWLKHREEKRLSALENGQKQVINGFTALLEAKDKEDKEQEKKIELLQEKIVKLTTDKESLRNQNQNLKAKNENLKVYCNLIRDSEKAPPEVQAWLEKHIFGKITKSDKSIRDIIYDRILDPDS